MSDHDDQTIVGFDLGDGESALALARIEASAEPAVLQLPGSSRKQHVTAVGELPTGRIVVGEAAIKSDDVRPLYLTFKSREFGDPEVRTPVEWFVRRVVSDVVETGCIELRATKFVFGAPSSWSENDRLEYASVISDAGIGAVDVVAESRAALLWAKLSGELAPRELMGTVLVVDIGSSTTDYTIVRATEEVPEDRGNPLPLGARLIDREILNRTVAAHPRADELRDILENDPTARRRLEFHCRMVKEAYFGMEDHFRTYPLSVGYTLRGPRGKEILNVELDGAAMDDILTTPLAALGDRSWGEALELDLRRTSEAVGGSVSVILLTGGPSRMAFVTDICARVFPGVKITPGAEPEFTIAKGLALVGHTATHVSRFRADLRELKESGKIQALASERVPSLISAMGEAAVSGIVEKLVVPVFLDWRRGKYRTLDDVQNEIQLRAHEFLHDRQNTEFRKLIAAWLNNLQPAIADLTAPICRQHQIPSDALTLPPVEVEGSEISMPVDTGVATETFYILMQAVTAMIATATFIVLIALHAAVLPLAPFLLVGTFAVVRSKGKEELLRELGGKNIPRQARRLLPEATLRAKLLAKAPEQEREMAEAFRARFLGDASTNRARLVETVASHVNAQLEELADEAEFIIKTKATRRSDQFVTEPVSV
ncbi:MAG: Hsp70 family protein [Solirubrobacteraceae bacterium]